MSEIKPLTASDIETLMIERIKDYEELKRVYIQTTSYTGHVRNINLKIKEAIKKGEVNVYCGVDETLDVLRIIAETYRSNRIEVTYGNSELVFDISKIAKGLGADVLEADL